MDLKVCESNYGPKGFRREASENYLVSYHAQQSMTWKFASKIMAKKWFSTRGPAVNDPKVCE